jgi:hypothetical protein
MRLDLRICWMTLGLLLKRTGISNSQAATMPQFTGSARQHTAIAEGHGSPHTPAQTLAA